MRSREEMHEFVNRIYDGFAEKLEAMEQEEKRSMEEQRQSLSRKVGDGTVRQVRSNRDRPLTRFEQNLEKEKSSSEMEGLDL